MGKQRQEAVILLIGDSHELCQVAAPLLKKTGYHVVEAPAEEAHAQALARRADLILLDLSVPETALAVAQQLEGDPTTAAIPLLYLTASEHEALPLTQGLEAGADTFLTKPVQEETLLSMVRGLVRMGRAYREARRDRDRLAEVLRQMPSGFILADGEGNLLLTNERAKEILQLPEIPQTDVERVRVMEPSFEGAFQGLEGWPLWRAINRGERTIAVEFELARGEGERVAVRVNAGPVRDSSGAIIAGALTFTDISDLKQAEQALRESEARFRAFVTASSDVVYRMSPDWREMRYLQGREFLADTLDPSRSWLEKYIHPDDRPHVLAVIQEAIRTKRAFELEHRVVRADGTLGWTFSRAIPLLDEQGEIVEWFGAASDITARKEAEESLRQLTEELEQRVAERAAEVRASEARWQGVVEGIADEVWLADAEGRMSLLNLPTVTAMGLEEFAGKPIEEVLREVEILRPDGSVRPPEESPLLRSLRGEIVRGEETMRHRRTGLVRYRQFSSAPTRDADGTITGAVAIVRDVTQQKRTEEERERLLVEVQQQRAFLEAVLEQSPIGVNISHDPFGLLITANEVGTEIFDVGPGENVSATAPPEERPANRYYQEGREVAGEDLPMQQAMREDRPVRNVELGLRTASGKQRWLLLNAAPVHDAAGKVIGGVGISWDITDRKKAEAALRQLADELEQRVAQRTASLEAANRELEAFSYSVSHDLRAPLRHIMSFVELLDKQAWESLDEKSRHYLEVITEAGQRMGGLIDDLLLFSRIGRAPLTERRVDLRQLVDEALQELAPEMQGREIEWQIGALPEVWGDPTLLRSALVNLLSNALKYTRPRDPARIDVGCQEQNGDTVCSVRDNGVGFDMRFADKLFRVFQRLHRPEDFEGTGIGLASVRRIIERHGGRAWAEGAIDHGATFSFSLPRRREGR